MSTLLFAQLVNAQPSRCSDVLLTETSNILNEQSQRSLAWLRLVDQSNYSQKKTEAGGSYGGLFSANYGQFNQRRTKLYEQRNFALSESDAKNLVETALPEGAIDAWRECMLGQNGLSVWLEDVEKNAVTLIINWKPAVGQGDIKEVEVDIYGGENNAKLEDTETIRNGEKRFILTRSPNEEIRGVINGSVGSSESKGSISESFYIPPFEIKDIVSLNPSYNVLYEGRTASKNAGTVGSHAGHLGGINKFIGYTVRENGKDVNVHTKLYEGQAGENAGYISTKSDFRNGYTVEWGYTVQNERKGTTQLFVVKGCGIHDGEVTTNPNHFNCDTTSPIGWTYLPEN